MPLIPFPNVPNVPGVPPLARSALASAGVALDLLTGDSVVGYGFGLSPGWGVYRRGLPVILCDTVIDMGYKRDWAIADYQVEQGGFASYDKVDLPFDIRVKLASGGSVLNREALLATVEAIAGDLNFYDVVTPERVYTSVNVQHYDYNRAARNGVGLVMIDLWLLEVRVTAGAGLPNTASPSGASTSQGGDVAPTDATPSQEGKSATITVGDPKDGGIQVDGETVTP